MLSQQESSDYQNKANHKTNEDELTTTGGKLFGLVRHFTSGRPG